LDQVVGKLSKLTGAQLFDLGLLHGRCTIVECGKVFMVWKACDAHLILDGSNAPLDRFNLNQLLERVLSE
jgi:hypothetical protein